MHPITLGANNAYGRMGVRESTETWNHRALAALDVLGSLRRHGDSRAGAAIPVDSVVLALLERTRVGRQTRGGMCAQDPLAQAVCV